jgi:hypothetical protein
MSSAKHKRLQAEAHRKQKKAEQQTEQQTKQPTEQQDNVCGICVEPTIMRVPCCNDYYHQTCLQQWEEISGKVSCPSCRGDYTWSNNTSPRLMYICKLIILAIISLAVLSLID